MSWFKDLFRGGKNRSPEPAISNHESAGETKDDYVARSSSRRALSKIKGKHVANIKKRSQPSGVSTSTPSSREIPIISVNQIREVLLTYETDTSDESERRWLKSIAPSVMKCNWPDIVNSCARRKSDVLVTVQFHPSASLGVDAIRNRATEINANVVIQPKTNLLGEDDHRHKEYGVTLAIFISRSSGGDKPRIALVAGNHRLQCTA